MLGLILLFGIFLILLFAEIPVFICMCAASLSVMVFVLKVDPLQTMLSMQGQIGSWTWASIPMLIILGNFMVRSGVLSRLISLAESFIGHIPGALSHVSVLTNAILAGMSGSLLADASAVGVALIPEMKKQGYPAGYAAAIVAAGSIIGPLIPPSLGLILVGVMGNISILRLWLGGAGPGILITILILIASYMFSKLKAFPVSKKAGWKKRGQSFVVSIPALLVPIILLGGMRAGVFTVTEGVSVGLMYVILIGWFLYGWKNLRDMYKAINESAKSSAAILITGAAAGVFSWVLSMLGAGQMVVDLILTIGINPIVFKLTVFIVVVILGCFMDTIPIILVLVPLLLPIAAKLGIDIIAFGVLIHYASLIGLLTPPMAMAMYVVIRIADTNVSQYVKYFWPFFLILILLGLMIVFFPQIVTFLPNLVMGVPK